MTRIGLIGGLSWESTAAYYRLLNQMTAQRRGAWQQPEVLIDSVNFADIVQFQLAGDWAATGEILAQSARRLESGGAEVLGISANTMHMNYDDVRRAVSIPVVDVRDAVAARVRGMGHESISLLGTKYIIESDFYSSAIEREGIRVVKPTPDQTQELHRMIYEELTQGLVTESSRDRFLEIAGDCRSRGGDVVGLCCTEFGLLVDESNAPWPFVDSTVAHVEALLSS
jgi:aspartate racemase